MHAALDSPRNRVSFPIRQRDNRPMPKAVERCPWCLGNDEYIAYHDRVLFEFLILEGAQAGLSWLTILRKRAGYRKAFAGFDPERVARFTEMRRERLMGDPGIVRNRAKIDATVGNARSFLAIQSEFGSFDRYLWRFVDGHPIRNRWRTLKQVPARTDVSDRLSKDLGQRGFKFTGSTICYAFMQAVGLVNDHLRDCFRHTEIAAVKSLTGSGSAR